MSSGGRMGHKLVIKKKSTLLKKAIIAIAIFGLVCISAYSGFFYSQLDVNPLREQITQLESENQQLNDRLLLTKQQLSEASLQARAATVAKEHLETTVKTLQADNTILNHDLSFYQRIMSPEKTDEGLQFADFQVVEESGETLLSAKIYQMGRHDRFRKGKVSFDVEVLEKENQIRKLSKAEVALLIEGERKFQFRYFQTLQFKLSKHQYQIKKITISVIDAKKRTINQELVWGK
jgi:hypothetical protein